MRSVWKITGLVSQTIYFNSKQQTTWLPHQVFPLELNALFHHSLLCTSMHCWNNSSRMSLSSVITDLLMASMPSKRVHLMIPLSLGERKKSHRAWSGEQEGCSTTAMFFSARNCQMFRVLWAGALSWWSSHNLSCRNSRLFSRTERSKSCRISL